MPPELKLKMPVVKNMVRLKGLEQHLLGEGIKKFDEKRIFYADSTFFQVFSFPLVRGNPATAMNRRDAVLITQDMAKKYFGDADPMGKTLRVDNKDYVTITGVLENIPANSHLQFDFLMPMSAIAQANQDLKESKWDNTTIIRGDIAEAISALKNKDGKDIIVYGGDSFVSSLIQHDLIDEYYILANPASLGNGQQTFNPLKNDLQLKLVRCKPFACGTVLLLYTK